MASSWRSQRRRMASRDWSELPEDVTALILQSLDSAELLETARLIGKTWRDMIRKNEPWLWRSIDYKLFWGITIIGDKLLEKAAKRLFKLRRLEIYGCENDVLMKAVQKLTYLEELHVYDQVLTEQVLETIGSSCENLVSLTIAEDIRDIEAQAIGSNMPLLRHLKIDGQMLTETGLQLILDGCLSLESLTLSNADALKLAENVAKDYKKKVEIDFDDDDPTGGHFVCLSDFDDDDRGYDDDSDVEYKYDYDWDEERRRKSRRKSRKEPKMKWLF